MRTHNLAGLPVETLRSRERDQPPPPRQASWTNESDLQNNNGTNQSVTRKVQTFLRGAANGASNGISKVMYSKDAPHSVHYGGEWSNSSLNPFDLTNESIQNSNMESRPFSAPNRQRHPMSNSMSNPMSSAPRSIPTAALMEAASHRGNNSHALQSWMNGIFRSQGIPKQVTEVSKSLSDGSTLPTLIEILAGESIPGIVDSRNLMQPQKLNNVVTSVQFLRSKGLALPQLENSLSEEVCRGEPTSCTALAQCIKDAYDPNGNASLMSAGNGTTLITSSSSLGRSHLPSPMNPSASIVSLNPSVATTQNSSLSASALDFSNQFGLDSHSYYGTRNSTTLGGGYTTNSSLDILPGTMLDLTPAANQPGATNGRRGVGRLPSFSSTQLSKMTVEQRKSRLKQNLLPNQKDTNGYRIKSYPNNGAAQEKDGSTTKSSSAFPTMEDQLKDLLKGNSEESLIAPGHDSTRFHLDYTAAGGPGYVPSALEPHHPRQPFQGHNNNNNNRDSGFNAALNGTESSLDCTVESTMTAPTMSYDFSVTDAQLQNQNFSKMQSHPTSIHSKAQSLPRPVKNRDKSTRDRSTEDHFRFDAVDERLGSARYRGSLGSTGGSSASSLNCLDTQMEEALRLYPPSPSSIASSMTPPLPPLSPGDTPPDSPVPPPHSPNPKRNPPIEIPHYAQPPSGRQSVEKRSSSRFKNRHSHEAINKGPPPDLLQGSELKSDRRNSMKGSSSAGRNSTSQPERIDLKKILPRPGFEPAGDTTADDSSIGIPDGGMKKTSKEENSVLRQQLAAMETIYKNVQGLVGGDSGTLGGGGGGGSGGSKSGIDAVGCGSEEDLTRTSRLHQKSLKRLARLEGHVVTLARSVAHLSSELRSQHLLSQDIEVIKENIKEMKMDREGVKPASGPQVPASSVQNSSWVASLANPHRVHKLTKFFGEEPPLLGLFLEKLGYERYLRHFEEEKIGMVELPYISEDRLQRLGIPMGPRMRILQEAQGALLNPLDQRGINSTSKIGGNLGTKSMPVKGNPQPGPKNGYSYYFV